MLRELSPHFQVFLPFSILIDQVNKGKAGPEELDEAINACLSSPWGTLGFPAPKNQLLVYPPAQHRPILRAAASWWPQLDIGSRYTVGMREGRRLWETVTNLQYLLGQVGVPIEAIRGRLPAGGLGAILPDGLID